MTHDWRYTGTADTKGDPVYEVRCDNCGFERWVHERRDAGTQHWAVLNFPCKPKLTIWDTLAGL